MSASKKKDTPTKREPTLKELIVTTKEEIIRECKLLATLKTSSAFNINAKTRELLKLEQEEKKS